MQSIPTLFVMNGNSLATEDISQECDWFSSVDMETGVPLNIGRPYRIFDGLSVKVEGGVLHRLQGETWVAVDLKATEGGDVVYVKAWDQYYNDDATFTENVRNDDATHNIEDGMYELCGESVKGNPEQFPGGDFFLSHKGYPVMDFPRTHQGINDFFLDRNIKGVVIEHPDGRKALVLRSDFGLVRPSAG